MATALTFDGQYAST